MTLKNSIYDFARQHCRGCGLVKLKTALDKNGNCYNCKDNRNVNKCIRCACGKQILNNSGCLCDYCYYNRQCEHDIIRLNCDICDKKKNSMIKLENGGVLKKFNYG